MNENNQQLDSRIKITLQKGRSSVNSSNTIPHENDTSNINTNINTNLNTEKMQENTDTQQTNNHYISTKEVANVNNIITIENFYNKVSINMNKNNDLLKLNNLASNVKNLKEILPIYHKRSQKNIDKINTNTNKSIDSQEVDIFKNNQAQVIEIKQKDTSQNADCTFNEDEMDEKDEKKEKDYHVNKLILNENKAKINTRRHKSDNSVNSLHRESIKSLKKIDLREEGNIIKFNTEADNLNNSDNKSKTRNNKGMDKGTEDEIYNINISLQKCFENILKFEYKDENNEFLKINDYNLNGSVHSSLEENKLTVCLMCDLHVKEENMVKVTCNHILCKICFKSYYEDLIERGVFYELCPLFFCKDKIAIEEIKTIVSDKHIDKYEQLKQDHKKLSIINEQECPFENKSKLESKNFKHLAQTNVILFNQDETMLDFYKHKESYCSKCYEPSIFSLSSRKYSKCLNCFNNICRYCFKDYTFDHYNLYSKNHCKIYFTRKNVFADKLKHNLKKNNIGFEILIIIISYILMVFAVYNEAIKGFNSCLCVFDKKGNRRICNTLFFVILMILFTCFWLVFIVIVMPFFPVFYTVFEVRR